MPYEEIIYIVKTGDTLWGIAKFFGTTIESIMKFNPEIEDPNLIYVGQRLLIGWI